MLWGDTFLGCGLEFGREVFEGAEEAVVDCWDDGEECDGFNYLWGGEEGRCEARPSCYCVKREEEFDCGAGEEGGENSVYGAVDVMEGEDVEEMVSRRVVPCCDERFCLSCKN